MVTGRGHVVGQKQYNFSPLRNEVYVVVVVVVVVVCLFVFRGGRVGL